MRRGVVVSFGHAPRRHRHEHDQRADRRRRRSAAAASVCVPSHAMISKLPNSAPTIPPIVFAAYTRADQPRRILLAADQPPRVRAGSSRPRDRRGQHRPTGSARDRSGTCTSASTARPGLTGQYGRIFVIEYAAHAIAPVSSNWQTPSASLGVLGRRARSPIRRCSRCRVRARNAARISENVYVVAPSSSDNRRVHTASAASAVAPDSPIAT